MPVAIVFCQIISFSIKVKHTPADPVTNPADNAPEILTPLKVLVTLVILHRVESQNDIL